MFYGNLKVNKLISFNVYDKYFLLVIFNVICDFIMMFCKL